MGRAAAKESGSYRMSDGFLAATFALAFCTIASAEGLTLIQKLICGFAGIVFLGWTFWLAAGSVL